MEPVKTSTWNGESNGTSELRIVYPEPIKELDEHTHYSTDDLKEKINELIRKANK